MIHDFATAPRKSDWRVADSELRSPERRVLRRVDSRADSRSERSSNRSSADLKAVRVVRLEPEGSAGDPVPVQAGRARVAKRNRLVLPLVVVCTLVFLGKWLLSGGEPVSDQQPDAAAKKEYEESILLSEEPLVEKVQPLLADASDKAGYGQLTVSARSQVQLDVAIPVSQKNTLPAQPTSAGASALMRAAGAVTGENSADGAPATDSDPDYEFYDSLKQGSWPVPINKGAYVDGELAERARPVYNLQAASFRSKEDADRLVNRLKAHRLSASVQPSVSSNGQYWYQVSVGPFVSTTNLNKAQDILVSMSMMPLKKRVQ